MWLKFKLRKVRSLMEANCLARIQAGRASNASEEAVCDWDYINSIIHDILKNSLEYEVSSERQSEDKPTE